MRIQNFTKRALLFGCLLAPIQTVASAQVAPVTATPTFEQYKRHLFQRFTYGPTPELLDNIQSMSALNAWFNGQLNAQSTLETVETLWLARNIAPDVAFPQGMAKWNFLTLPKKQTYLAIESDAQTREVMTYFWENLFSTSYATIFGGVVQEISGSGSSINKTVNQTPGLVDSIVWIDNNTYRQYALTTFREILHESYRSPAMRVYLNLTSMYEGESNEDYARELLELHTLGTDNGLGQANYTDADINLIAEILTGTGVDNVTAEPLFNPNGHNPPPFNTGIFVNTSNQVVNTFSVPMVIGNTDNVIEDLLDHLVDQEQTKRHICNRMIEFFVGEPAAINSNLLNACVAAWDVNGGGGNIKAILSAIQNSPEFLAAAIGKKRVESPLETCLSQARIFGGSVHGATNDQEVSLDGYNLFLNRTGQPLFQHPSPDGFPLGNQEHVSTSNFYERFDLANSLIGVGLGNTTYPVDQLDYSLKDLAFQRVNANPLMSQSSAADVTQAMLQLTLGTRYTAVEQNLGEVFLNEDLNGNASPWSPTSPDASGRIELLCAYIATLPQSFEK